MKIEIYTTSICPFCHAAKKLLTDKGADFSEISLTQEPHLRDRMIERAKGGRTVPQISSMTRILAVATIFMRLTPKANSIRSWAEPISRTSF